MKVRHARTNDCFKVFQWRNDAVSQQMSHTSGVTQWESHTKWFNSALNDKNRVLLMCEEGRGPSCVAIVRFDISNSRAIISININPLMRGRGLAKACLAESISFFNAILPQISYIDAEIKSINTASRRAFESVGFEFLREVQGVLYYQLL